MNTYLSDPISMRGQVSRYFRDSFIYMMISLVMGTLFVLFLHQSVESTIICLVFSVGCFYQSLVLPIKTSDKINRQFVQAIISLKMDKMISKEYSHLFVEERRDSEFDANSTLDMDVKIENLKMARSRILRDVKGYAINVASFWLNTAFIVSQITVLSISIFGN